MYDPTVLVSTDPEDVTSVTPWKSSKAVAPSSTYVEPSSTVAGLSPLIVITGGTLSLYPSSVKADTAPRPAIAKSAFCIADNSAVTSASLLLKVPLDEEFPASASTPSCKLACSESNTKR